MQALDVGIFYSRETQNGAGGVSDIQHSGEVCDFGRDSEAKSNFKMDIISPTLAAYYEEGEGKQKWLSI